MAASDITGYTEKELATLEGQYYNTPKWKKTETPFDTAYCLARIGKQPDEYDGPQRYCVKRTSRLEDGSHAFTCNFHGSRTSDDADTSQLTPLGNLKHGMYATDDHLEESFEPEDQKLYDFIMSWADAYGWPAKEDDPARYDLLEQVAIERVRVARSEKFILEEGEMDREEIYDENGNPRTVTNPHGLSEDIRLKRKLVLDVMKELGLTPKSKSSMNTDEKTASAAEQLAEVAGEVVLNGSDDGFDPDSEMFADEG